MEYKRIFKDGSHLLTGKIGTVIIGLVNLMILTRILSIEDMGRYSIILMVVSLGVQLGLNWSDASIIRHGREELVKRNKINFSFWARMCLFIPLLILFTAGFIFFKKTITQYAGVDEVFIVFIIGLFVFTALQNLLMYTLRSIDKMTLSSYLIFSQKLLYLLGLILFLFNIISTTLLWVMFAINISFLISVAVFTTKFDFKKIFPIVVKKNYFKKIWKYSWPQLIGFSGLYIINYIDIWVIRKYMGLQDVGMYDVAYKGFSIIAGSILLINVLFLPLIVEYKSKNKWSLIQEYTKKIPLATGGWTILVIIGLLSSPFFIPLFFSAKYTLSVPSFNVLLIASIFYFMSICFLPLLNAFDFIIHLQVLNIIKSVVNIIADLIFVPIYGIIGAAYGTLLAYAVGLILTLILVYMKRKEFLGKKIIKKTYRGEFLS